MLLLVRITLATLCTSPLFAAHALAFTLCVGLGITSGSGGALAEASNQALDLAIHSSALQPMLTALTEHAVPQDFMAYGHARLSLLTKFSITFCAAASAALILLDALLELCLLGRANHHHHTGAHHSQEHRHQDRSGALAADKAATTPWAVVGASVATAALVLLQTGSETEQRKQRVTVRVALLLLCAWLGAGMTETHQELHGNVGLASRVADRSSTDPLPSFTPPLLRLLLQLLLRQPDACAAAALAVVALCRGYVQSSVPARLLLQAAPSQSMLPDLDARMERVRAAHGVVGLRDVRLWAVDEFHCTGSLVVLAAPGTDLQQVTRHTRAALEGGALTELTVSVNHDGGAVAP